MTEDITVNDQYSTVTEAKARGMINNWMGSEVLTLGNHFQGSPVLDSEPLTYDPDWRVSNMEMTEDDLNTLNKLGEVRSFRLCMSLEETRSEGVNVAPLLHVVGDKKKEHHFRLYTPADTLKQKYNITGSGVIGKGGKKSIGLKKFMRLLGKTESAEVPVQFLQTVRENWLLLDPAQMDDLFMAYRNTNTVENEVRRLSRLTEYRMNAGTNALLFNKLRKLAGKGKLTTFRMHFGVDFNKQPNQGEFTFTPVIELGTSDNLRVALKKHAKELKGISLSALQDMPVFSSVTGDGEDGSTWFFEYIKPCPPC